MVIGIDPGSVSAAYGVLDSGGAYVVTGDLPVTPHGKAGKVQINGKLCADLLRAIAPNPTESLVIVEAVGAMPKQGVSSMFRFGVSYGIILGVLGALGLPFLLVSPVKWKRAAGLGKVKDESRTLALRLWPDSAPMLTRKKDNNRSDALLLARYGVGR